MATQATTLAPTVPAGAALRRFGLLVQTTALIYLRNRSSLFWIIVFPIGLMLLFGAIWGNAPIDPSDPQSITILNIMVPGLIILSLSSNGLIGNASTLAVYRERGILRRIQTTPLPVWQLLLARVITQSAILVGQAGLLVGTSMLAFGARYDALGLIGAIPMVILGAVLFMAMGQAIAALVQKSDTVQLVGQAINLPLMFLGGLTIPLEVLPPGLRAFGQYLPSALLADLVRAPMLAGLHVAPHVPLEFAFLGVLLYFAASVGIAARFFKWS